MSEQFKYVTEEELQGLSPNGRILAAMMAARKQDDEEEFSQLQKQVLYPPETLMFMKKTMGADWIKQRNLRMDEADKVYGHGWLDR